MKEIRNHIHCLLDKYLSGNYTPEELDQLFALLETSGGELDRYLESVWEGILETEPEKRDAAEIERYKKEAGQIILQQKQRRRRKSRIRYFMRAAAAILLLISISAVLYRLRPAAPAVSNRPVLISTGAPCGDRHQFYLEDSSLVFLNSGSRLYYPESFGADKREALLSGEAFFEVTPGKNRAFIVKTADMTVTVLGTSFNVKDYESDDHMSVTVVDGEVSVAMNDANITLLPDERLFVHKRTGEFTKTIVQADRYARWRKGTLCFSQTPLQEVIATLERWYDVEIRVDGTYPVFITGEHDNRSLASVLESVCFTSGLKYSKKENHYILYHP
ncbi:MAG: FecR domain-containing protein [Bacteroidales bacterium]|jgi:ferric-dicitrate binding protein FerR (iron transport regulator)|nr:FecR domain-containing protein [Bacteroidales bacterium]